MISRRELRALTRKQREVRAHPETPMPPRWLTMCRRLYEGGTITIRWLRESFGVSLATAKRDMALIEANLPCVRDARENTSQPVTIRLLRGPRVHGHITDDIRKPVHGRRGSRK